VPACSRNVQAHTSCTGFRTGMLHIEIFKHVTCRRHVADGRQSRSGTRGAAPRGLRGRESAASPITPALATACGVLRFFVHAAVRLWRSPWPGPQAPLSNPHGLHADLTRLKNSMTCCYKSSGVDTNCNAVCCEINAHVHQVVVLPWLCTLITCC
jgi:hypothetical protein